MPLTFRQLEAFHAVMSAGSFTRAATLLGVSQPAISRMLADLEANAGFPLFERMARRLRPTERARLLHAEVERSLSGLAQIESVAAALRERGEGQLRLAIVPSLLPVVSERLIAPFAAAYPAASIVIEVPTTLNALDWTSPLQADLGISFETIRQPGASSEPIGTTEAVCLLPAGHPLAGRAAGLGPADLVGLPFVSYRLDASFRADVDRVFDEAGIRRDLRFEARTTAAVAELVAALGGVSIIPCPGPGIAADRRLALLRFRPALVSAVIIVRPAGAASPLARAFSEFALAHPIDFLAGLLPTASSGQSRKRA